MASTVSDYEDIIALCAAHRPALIYVAIGCAQGHNNPDHRTPQQFPPFIRECWPIGEVIAILIDPALEPATELQGLLDADGDPEVAFIPLYREFQWADATDSRFMMDLCQVVADSSHTQMVVQDYTGDEIAPRLLQFALTLDGEIHRRVLFDTTYGQAGGCYVDFSSIHILRDVAGRFIQPRFLPAAAVTSVPDPTAAIHLRQAATERVVAIRQYIQRWARAAATLPAWCSEEKVRAAAAAVGYPYNFRTSLSPTVLESLIAAVADDFATAAGAPRFSREEIADLIHEPTGERLAASLYVLRDLFAPVAATA